MILGLLAPARAPPPPSLAAPAGALRLGATDTAEGPSALPPPSPVGPTPQSANPGFGSLAPGLRVAGGPPADRWSPLRAAPRRPPALTPPELRPVEVDIPAHAAPGGVLTLASVAEGRRPVALSVGPGAEAVLVLTAADLLTIPSVSLILHPKARLSVLADFPASGAPRSVTARLSAGARLHLVALSIGAPRPTPKGGGPPAGPVGAQDVDVVLEGEGAEADLRGVTLLLADARAARTAVRVHHSHPRTRSTQLLRSVVEDGCSHEFRGTVAMDRAAVQGDASQLAHALLLHGGATARLQPTMRIFADDVKAAHGATTGGPSPEALFYLQARGLAAPTARRLYVQAFIRSLVDGIADPRLRAVAAAWVAANSGRYT